MFRTVGLLFVVAWSMAGLLITTGGCTRENEEELFSDINCDTTGVISYANDIVPMIQAQCYGCHSGQAQAGAGIILDNYTAFTAYSHRVLEAISKQPNEPKFMPQGGSRLPDCFILKLHRWMERGLPDN